MNSNIVVVGESSFMDFSHVRENLVRITEVMDVLNQAQKFWDELRGVKSLVLSNSFYSSDDYFRIHPEYKNFLNDLVQYALFLRLKNQNMKPEYVIANVNLTRAHLLMLNINNLKEFVFKHPAVRSFNKETKLVRPLHAIHAEPKYAFFRLSDCGIKTIKSSPQITDIFEEIENSVVSKKIINLGLGQNIKLTLALGKTQKIQIFDSVSNDSKLKDLFVSNLENDSAISVN